jgi:hypothetical protein
MSVRMRWGIGVLAGLLLVVFVVGQLVLPRIAESRIADRLTVHGGVAHVSVRSRPAVRLLFGDGQRIAITARGISVRLPPLDSAERDDALRHLDGFGRVDLRFSDVTAGPLKARTVDLTRSRSGAPYELTLAGTASPVGLAEYVGGALAGLGAGLLTGDEPLPFAGSYAIRSDHGHPRVLGGSGAVAGVPIGTLGAALLEAVVGRL